MMVAFNVTNLEKWGYDASTMFIDPMQPEFRPKDIHDDHYTEDAIMDKMNWFYGTNAYNHGDVAEVYSQLDEFF
jgi:bilirubin oxidase